jgi:hypothetical protein
MDTGAAGAHPFGQRPLRRQLDFQLAGEVLAMSATAVAADFMASSNTSPSLVHTRVT